MKKKFKVIDTNTIFAGGAEVLTAFQPKPDDKESYTTLIITPVLTDEAEERKHSNDQNSRNVRAFYAELDRIVRESGRRLPDGIRITDHYEIRSIDGYDPHIDALHPNIRNTNDGYLLKVSIDLQLKNPDVEVELIANDRRLRNDAHIKGILANPWKDQQAIFRMDELYLGWRDVLDVDSKIISSILKGPLHPDELGLEGLLPNEYLRLFNPATHQPTLAKYVVNSDGSAQIEKIGQAREDLVTRVRGELRKQAGTQVGIVKPRNDRQAMAMDAMADHRIKIVTIPGPAGTGKTFTTIESAYLLALVQDSEYSKVGLIRSMVEPKKQQIGFLPGKQENKMRGKMLAFHDNLDELGILYHFPEERIERLMDDKRLSYESIADLRGRNLARGIYIVGDCQNVSQPEIWTILTRYSQDAKIVLEGDPSYDQIDDPDLSPETCGLVWANQEFASSRHTATIGFLPEDVTRHEVVKDLMDIRSKNLERRGR